MKSLFFYKTDIGEIGIADDGVAITNLFFPIEQGQAVLAQAERAETPLIRQAFQQLTEYFAGTRTVFSVPLCAEGTAYQKRVWHELTKIPYGETRSYKQIAEGMGGSFSRAVGNANGKNPISIFIPCHRVVGADGSLRGYAGGVHTKRALLKLEGIDRWGK